MNAFGTTLSDSGIRGQYKNGRGAIGPWAGPAGRLLGPELKELVANGIDKLLSVLVIIDDDVEPDNRVTTSAYFGGDPWVRTEPPVVSTDPRISVRLGQLGLSSESI